VRLRPFRQDVFSAGASLRERVRLGVSEALYEGRVARTSDLGHDPLRRLPYQPTPDFMKFVPADQRVFTLQGDDVVTHKAAPECVDIRTAESFAPAAASLT
jgi:hypothetical protein